MSSRPRRRRGETADAPDQAQLAEIRRRYFLEGIEPNDRVAAAVLRSWQRSRALGLEPDGRVAGGVLTADELRTMREGNELLLQAARGEIEALFQDARATNGIVILTDPRGVILDAVGNADFAEYAARVLLRPGVQWDEASTGTNAIGTAIAEASAIAITGAEHFFDDHNVLGCSAVPIFDPSGHLTGVLDISNSVGLPQTHTLALVKRAVEQIERRLFERRFGRHENFAFHSDPDLVNSPHEGLLAFEGDQLVGANRRALELLRLDWSALGLMRFDQIFSVDRDRVPRDGPVDANKIPTQSGSFVFGQMRAASRAGGVARPSVVAPERIDARAPPFDRQIAQQLDRAVRLADAGVSILIQGEVGSGKELFARHLHGTSRHREGPFLRLDCSAQSVEDLEHALFGSSAAAESAGPDQGGPVLVGAPGGTLLLVAVEALPMPLQVKLAAALRPAEPGDPAARRRARDFNLIAVTDLELRERVAAGGFSAELAVRIAAHLITLPPLRLHADRETVVRDTWAALVGAEAADRLNEEAVEALANYAWPGNRRQLIATLRSLAVLAGSRTGIGVEALPREIRDAARPAAGTDDTANLSAELGSQTLAAMRHALAAENGNVSRAARRLGIHRSTLYRRLFGPGQGHE